jgi:hypothetical protein
MINGRSLAIALFLVSATAANCLAGETNDNRKVAGAIYLEPRVITGTIYESTDLKKVLFNFRRTATNSGSTIKVLREYTLPNGRLAAWERIEYVAGVFRSYHFEDLQNPTLATAVVKPDAGKGDRIVFDFKQGTTLKNDSEKLERSTLVNDMVVPFILENWDALMRGETVKCRLVTVSRTETIGFKFALESKRLRKGKPVVVIRMEPTSPVIARFVETLFFTLENASPHRVYQYYGRTAPAIFRSGKWEDLDALTVFDWK